MWEGWRPLQWSGLFGCAFSTLQKPSSLLAPCSLLILAVLARYCLQAGVLFHQLGSQSARPCLYLAP